MHLLAIPWRVWPSMSTCQIFWHASLKFPEFYLTVSEIKWIQDGTSCVDPRVQYTQCKLKFPSILISLIFSNQIVQLYSLIILIQLSYSPTCPQGGHLNTQPPLISWWSYSVLVLCNSDRMHRSTTPPPVFYFFFFFSLNDVTTSWHQQHEETILESVPAPWKLQDPKGDHSVPKITTVNLEVLIITLGSEQQRRR